MATEESKLKTQQEQLDTPVVRKRSQIQFEIGQLLYQINSRYGTIGDIHPTEEQQLEMYKKIADLREQLKSVY